MHIYQKWLINPRSRYSLLEINDKVDCPIIYVSTIHCDCVLSSSYKQWLDQLQEQQSLLINRQDKIFASNDKYYSK